jgi:type IV secretion system protein VirB2
MFKGNYPGAFLAILLFVSFALLTDAAFASSGATGTGGSGLPWEKGLMSLRNSITGPVAFTVLLISLVGIGATLAFGSEINHVLRAGILFVLAGAFVASGAQIISILFSGAVIEDVELALLAIQSLGVA